MPKGGSPTVTKESVEEMIARTGQREQESLLVLVRHPYTSLPQCPIT